MSLLPNWILKFKKHICNDIEGFAPKTKPNDALTLLIAINFNLNANNERLNKKYKKVKEDYVYVEMYDYCENIINEFKLTDAERNLNFEADNIEVEVDSNDEIYKCVDPQEYNDKTFDEIKFEIMVYRYKLEDIMANKDDVKYNIRKTVLKSNITSAAYYGGFNLTRELTRYKDSILFWDDKIDLYVDMDDHRDSWLNDFRITMDEVEQYKKTLERQKTKTEKYIKIFNCNINFNDNISSLLTNYLDIYIPTDIVQIIKQYVISYKII